MERLVELGLTQSEARTYLALLQQPEATGYELANAAGLQRANAYAALKSLTDKGFATQSGDTPARFVGASPEQALGQIKRRTQRRVDSLVADLAHLAEPSARTTFHTLQGTEAIIQRVAALVDGARDRVAVCCWSEDLDWLAAPLRAASASGCQVVVNVFGDSDLDVGEVFQHEDPDRTVGGHLLLVAIDHRVALVSTLEHQPSAIQTDQPALSRVVEKLIRQEAYLAAIFERHHDLLTESFGPHLVELRSRLLPADQADELVSIVGFGADDFTDL